MLVIVATLVALCTASPALGDIYFVIDQASVRPGGFITGSGNGSGMSVYLVPVQVAPRPYACGARAVCSPQTHMRLRSAELHAAGQVPTDA